MTLSDKWIDSIPTQTRPRFLKYSGVINAISGEEPRLANLPDVALEIEADDLRDKLRSGPISNDVIVSAFALAREAAKRTIEQRHYDVQLAGGIILHEGAVAEMQTGEGKTLTTTLPAFLNALAGKSVHIVTVNDYLAKRDAHWMRKIYEFFGMSVGCITHELDDDERKKQYEADIVYCNVNDVVFDYLRDNMKHSLEQIVQTRHDYAIIDEADLILIDEARTPLTISQESDRRWDHYETLSGLIGQLKPEHYEANVDSYSVYLTESGRTYVDKLLFQSGLLMPEMSIYDNENVDLLYRFDQSLKAHKTMLVGRDYLVDEETILLIDPSTGRTLPGKRYGKGLHQAIEAKEGVLIQPECETVAEITIYNYFNTYQKIAGMTGTAITKSREFLDGYELVVVGVPRQSPLRRVDHNDEVYRTSAEKYKAIVTQIMECKGRGQPVLVGTASVRNSEFLSDMLHKAGLPHQLLNATREGDEAEIIARAGEPGMITIASNMAGRGTDIQLGGARPVPGIPPEQRKPLEKAWIERRRQVIAAGGLFVIGTERNESRRVDNQLCGRSARQGDPGETRFYISLEDGLMRIFGAQRMDFMLRTLGIPEDEAITHEWINRALSNAQNKIAFRDLEWRKQARDFDDMLGVYRSRFYARRREIMTSINLAQDVRRMRQSVVTNILDRYFSKPDALNQYIEFREEVKKIFDFTIATGKEWAAEEHLPFQEIAANLAESVEQIACLKETAFGTEVTRQIELAVILQTIDHHWHEFIFQFEQLRATIASLSIKGTNRLAEIGGRSQALFDNLWDNINREVVGQLMHVQLLNSSEDKAANKLRQVRGLYTGDEQPKKLYASERVNNDALFDEVGRPPIESEIESEDHELLASQSRNSPCACGSGKKFKHCHGAYQSIQ